MIRKRGNKWCVISHTTGKSLGCYPTKAQAQKRLKQIQFYKARVGAFKKRMGK